MKLIKTEKIENQECYDIEVENTHCFFANGILVHNSNAGVCYNNLDGFWIQSRENIITPTPQTMYKISLNNETNFIIDETDFLNNEIKKDDVILTHTVNSVNKIKTSDNAGFAFFATKNEKVLTEMMISVAKENNIDLDKYTMSLYGEWAGPGIQKGVGISMLPQKSFFIFGIKYSDPTDPAFGAHWLDCTKLKSEENFIYNVNDFPTYEVDIDFNMPQLIQNKLIELTIAVEDECPVAKAFGNENTVGEGIVFTCEYKGIIYRFKSKGERHSVSKVKTLNSVDVEKLNSINEFIEYAVTEPRFDQAIEKVFGEIEPTIEKMGDVIRWVVSDITKEETDTMIENNLEPKDVNKYISTKVRQMFMVFLDKKIMG